VPLRILVTNDDGYASQGIDAVVEALRALPDVEITVVAPAENQSGRGDSTTDGPVEATDTTTASGYPAVAVAGTPADSVNHALDVVLADAGPDLVVSGSNEGQNLGIITDVSGTVGAARTAARRGIPALAISQGIAEAPDFAAGVTAALDWIEEHRDAVLSFEGATADVWSINAPTCAVGVNKGVIEIATATESIGTEVGTDTDCSVELAEPSNDVEAFNAGWITLSNVGLD
jgi:5'-nucleotidase